MSNTKKLLLVSVLIVICIILLKLVFDLSSKYSTNLGSNIVPNGEQTANALLVGGRVVTNNEYNTDTVTKLIESKGLSEFDSSTNNQPKNYKGDPADFRKNEHLYRSEAILKYGSEEYNDAIINFTKAIQIRKENPQEISLEDSNYYMLYWGRAESYLNLKKHQSAIDDYSRAISINFAQGLILINIETIRSVYPEFSDISNNDLIEGLRQKYDPTSNTVEYFNFMTQQNKADERKTDRKSDLTKLYLSRGDAYKEKGALHAAALDYRRAIHNAPVISNFLGIERQKIVDEN